MGEDAPKRLADLLEELNDQIDGSDTIGVDDVLGAFGSRAFGPLLAIPALLALSPIGALPGAPVALSVLITLIAAQHLFGSGELWLPGFLRDRSIPKDKWENAENKLLPWAKRIDRVIRPRLEWVVQGAMDRVIAAASIVLALAMIPLGLIPFAVMVPAAALLAMGLALTARDGLLGIVGFGFAAVTGWLVLTAM